MLKHWTYELFVEKADVVEKILFGGRAEASQRTQQEVDGLVKIFEQQGVGKGAKILDLCCGIGRHAIALAQRGYEVLGVDISPRFLQVAERRARELNLSDRVTFRCLDVRELHRLQGEYGGYFDAAISMFTSLGYYGEEEDVNVLRSARKLVKDRGLLVVDIANRDRIVKIFRARDIVDIGEDLVVVEERKFDALSSTDNCKWTVYKKENGNLKLLAELSYKVRLYSLHELVKVVERAGWRFVAAYGDLSLDEFVFNESRRIVLVARIT